MIMIMIIILVFWIIKSVLSWQQIKIKEEKDR